MAGTLTKNPNIETLPYSLTFLMFLAFAFTTGKI
jgi:hypothetical protein